MKCPGFALVLILLPLPGLAAEPRLSNQAWLDALLSSETARDNEPAAKSLPFSQKDHPAPLHLPFMPLPGNWHLYESQINGAEQTWTWRRKWQRSRRELTLTRAAVLTEQPLALRQSLHTSATRLRCLKPTLTPVRQDRVGKMTRWRWGAECRKKHGGQLWQQFVLLAGAGYRYDLVLEWHDREPEAEVRRRWQRHLDDVRPCDPGECSPFATD